MTQSLSKSAAVPEPTAPQLHDTRDAFDSVAADYDGPRGNNLLIQEMRTEMWRWLDMTFKPPARLIDIGCGTGLDAVRMAQLGHEVTATDWSPKMADRTRERAERERVTARVQVVAAGGQDFASLPGDGIYDGAYSNLGPLNCVPDLRELSAQCARLLKPGGKLVFTVIGRFCPWEFLHYALRRRWRRATIRFARQFVPVTMNRHTIWTRYYRPTEFYAAFAEQFALKHYRGLCTFAPPPYLTWLRDTHPGMHGRLWRLDRRTADWPVIRSMGDHFLIILEKR